jgi:multidrug efflux pump subunit AcrB
VIAWALDHRWAVVAISVGTFVFALSMPAIKIGNRTLVGVSFFPADDNAEFNVKVETPPGSNLDYTRLKTEEVVRIISAHKDVVRYSYATLGAEGQSAVDQGMIYAKMVPRHDRSIDVERFSSLIRDELQHVGGATTAVFATDWGGGRKQVQIELRSTDGEKLAVAADRALVAVRGVPNAVDVGLSSKGQKPELNVELDRGLSDRWASRSVRWRSRCAPPSPHRPATGRIQAARCATSWCGAPEAAGAPRTCASSRWWFRTPTAPSTLARPVARISEGSVRLSSTTSIAIAS